MCLYGFYGQNCSRQCTDDSTCFSHGSCIEGGGVAVRASLIGRCLCDEGWSGEHCDTQKVMASRKATQLLVALVFFLLLLLQICLWRRQQVVLLSPPHF